MKRMFWVLYIFIISSFMLGCSDDPYAGKYKTPNNTILELSVDGKCEIINNHYKEVFYTYGKYTINNNQIEITFDEDKENYLRVEGLKGKVKGSNIEFYDYFGDGKQCTYSKMG